MRLMKNHSVYNLTTYIGEDTGLSVVFWYCADDDRIHSITASVDWSDNDDIWDDLSEHVQERIKIEMWDLVKSTMEREKDRMEALAEDAHDARNDR